MGSMYVQCIQGILPNVPACTTFIKIYNHSSGLFGMCTYLGTYTYHRNRPWYLHIPLHRLRYVHVPRSVQSVQMWTYLGLFRGVQMLYISMNVVRSGTLGQIAWTYCTYPDPLSSPLSKNDRIIQLYKNHLKFENSCNRSFGLRKRICILGQK